MLDSEFDRLLVAAAFRLIAEGGWRRLTVAAAARNGDLPLDRARARFPSRLVVLMRFGSIADQEALASMSVEQSYHDQLLEVLMRRMDVLQRHRDGVLALLRDLPADPCAAAWLTAGTLRSMAWMLDGAEIDSTGPVGMLRMKGLGAVWLYGVHTWRNDFSEGLDSTTRAVDTALRRAAQVAGWLRGRRGAPVDTAPAAGEPDQWSGDAAQPIV